MRTRGHAKLNLSRQRGGGFERHIAPPPARTHPFFRLREANERVDRALGGLRGHSVRL